MKKALILVLVATVLFSSGCVGLEGIMGNEQITSTAGGVVIHEFSSDFPDYESENEDVELYMEVENVGGSMAEDVWAHLYDIDEDVWDPGTTDFSQEVAAELEQPDTLADIPGEIADVEWELQTPTGIPEGVVFKYTPRARLMYNYETIASATIPVLTKEEYKRLRERNMLNLPPVTTEVTKGPLAVEIVARTPVVVDDPADDTIDFRITVDLLERGSLIDPDHDMSTLDITSDEMDIIELEINADGVDGASGSDCDAYDTPTDQTLRRGQSFTYSCDLDPKDFSTRTDIPVTVTLRYGYFEDVHTTVTVEGAESP